MLADKLVSIDSVQRKPVVHTGIVGGGKACYELLKLFHCYFPRYLDITIVGVADPRPDAIGRRYAEQQEILTVDDLTTLLQLPDLDLVIELTGKDTVLEEIFRNKYDRTRVLDHLGAQFLWEIIDIQQQKLQLEQRMGTLDTMTAVGEMAFRLTHELRNPLMVAGGTVRRTMTRIDLPHGARKRLKMVAGSIQKMEEVLSDICDVVRPLYPKFKLVDLGLFFEDFCKAAGIEARFARSGFSCLLEEDLPEIVIDPSLLRQALWHLFENCFDAAAGEDSFVQLRVDLCYDYIVIQVEDEGGGFSGISSQSALNPFVSTRRGRLGLGLTLCRQIIQEHGGDMELWNNQRGGVTVTLSIPISFTVPAENKQTAFDEKVRCPQSPLARQGTP